MFTFTSTHQYLDDAPGGTASDTYAIDVRVLDLTPDLLVADGSGIDLALVRFDGGASVQAWRTVRRRYWQER